MGWQEGDIGFFDDLEDAIDLDESYEEDPEELEFGDGSAREPFDWMEGYDE